ncbi:MAG: helix-turn-helix domain-containing protein [Desulfobacterales bacterium]|nr:helix-turn-helix domain-containing protein [Desulfobacterales bacterium]
MRRELKLLGERIRGFRKAKGLTQEKLAELAALHPTFISEIETGKANYSISTLLSIADALKINPAELLLFKTTEKETSGDFEFKLAKISKLIEKKDSKTQEKLFSIIEILLS